MSFSPPPFLHNPKHQQASSFLSEQATKNTMMALPHSFLSLFSSLTFLLLLQSTQSKLNTNYYNKTCPQLPAIIEEIITSKQITSPSTAAATLRLFFHDCMVDGCDASALITSNTFNTAERDADINHSLPGDGFDVITRIKTSIELQCPRTVSCSDILALATRDLITMVGGPYYVVKLGRKDGFVSNASRVEGNLARPTMPMSKIISIFESKGLTTQEMVALVGAHTIGFSHCKEFSDRLFNFSKNSKSDPSYYPKYAERLKELCGNYKNDTAMSAFNDVMTPNKFDNMYYKNLQRGLGLLSSDQAMAVDKRTKPFVDLYAANQTAFFQAFGKAMEKLSVYKVKTGRKGEVRHRCDSFNNINT